MLNILASTIPLRFITTSNYSIYLACLLLISAMSYTAYGVAYFPSQDSKIEFHKKFNETLKISFLNLNLFLSIVFCTITTLVLFIFNYDFRVTMAYVIALWNLPLISLIAVQVQKIIHSQKIFLLNLISFLGNIIKVSLILIVILFTNSLYLLLISILITHLLLFILYKYNTNSKNFYITSRNISQYLKIWTFNCFFWFFTNIDIFITNFKLILTESTNLNLIAYFYRLSLIIPIYLMNSKFIELVAGDKVSKSILIRMYLILTLLLTIILFILNYLTFNEINLLSFLLSRDLILQYNYFLYPVILYPLFVMYANFPTYYNILSISLFKKMLITFSTISVLYYLTSQSVVSHIFWIFLLYTSAMLILEKTKNVK